MSKKYNGPIPVTPPGDVWEYFEFDVLAAALWHSCLFLHRLTRHVPAESPEETREVRRMVAATMQAVGGSPAQRKFWSTQCHKEFKRICREERKRRVACQTPK